MLTENYFRYRTRFSEIREHIIKRESRKRKEQQLKDFSFVSANLYNFLPKVPQEEHEAVYLDILSNTALLSTALDFPDLIDNLQIEGDTSFMDQPDRFPALFCTYHLGSYRSIIGYLAKFAIDFVLIVDTNTFNKQQEKIKNTFDAIQGHFGKRSKFELIDAERVDIAITLSRCLQEGKSIVAYLDGNTGVGGVYSKNSQMIPVSFLAKHIYSRKGIATLSYATKRPIIPVVSYYKEKESTATLHFYPPVDPQRSTETAREYCATATARLYTVLADKLEHYYAQWEGWLYLHKYLDYKTLISEKVTDSNGQENVASKDLSFNSTAFSLFKMDTNCYVLQKATYRAFEVNESIYSALHDLACQKGPRGRIAQLALAR